MAESPSETTGIGVAPQASSVVSPAHLLGDHERKRAHCHAWPDLRVRRSTAAGPESCFRSGDLSPRITLTHLFHGRADGRVRRDPTTLVGPRPPPCPTDCHWRVPSKRPCARRDYS